MDENYYHDHSGQRATGIGLAAGLGGGALLLAIAGIWGVNKASEARNQGTMALAAANAAALGTLNNNLLAERTSRESWQTANQPSVQSYIDVQATPQQTTTASAAAEAAAYAQLYNNSALNSAIGTDSFLKVCRYSAPTPCGCDSCNG